MQYQVSFPKETPILWAQAGNKTLDKNCGSAANAFILQTGSKANLEGMSKTSST